ncbi:MAG: PD40 domain-containing protein, partial [Anaerolineae bacterium]|nr:PD40 domain-containing protein [Anaerolineae bacterium]
MFPRLHPNTKTALSLIAGTLASVAAVVLLVNFHAALVAQPERIFFANFDGNDYEIYVMNLDGSDVVQLTDNDSDDWGPSVSPNGRRVAFRSDRDGAARVYVMNMDGTGAYAISPAGISTGTPLFTTAPAWSPNGTMIAYEASVDNIWNIYVSSAYGHSGCSGSDMMQVTFGTSLDAGPSFSPDGTQLAFHSYRYGEPD